MVSAGFVVAVSSVSWNPGFPEGVCPGFTVAVVRLIAYNARILQIAYNFCKIINVFLIVGGLD